jgi:hypothetical protein
MGRLIFALIALAATVPARAQDLERWDLTSPRVVVRLNAGLMRDLGIRVSPALRPDRDGYVAHAMRADGRLVALSPNTNLRTDIGELTLAGGPRLSFRGGAVTLRGARVLPGAEPNSFRIVADDGTPLFFADHQHFVLDRKARQVRLFNMDLRLSAEMAARLGEPRHDGLAVGVLEITLRASIPEGPAPEPLGACVNPEWGNPHNDVMLLNMSQVSQVALGGGVVAIAPSATLKNAGVTDVPWQVKFSPPAPPYNTDQHPYLVWNLYRLSNGRFEQLGASGLKHAFLSTNSNCGCSGASGSVLWVGNGGCEDTYGVSTNNSTGSLGPRGEITAHTGVWQRCGSIFDPDCNGAQDPAPPFSGPSDPRRLTVPEADLTTAGAQYFFESWYVVRDDVDIFNTMAWRTITPTFNGTSWSFGPFGAQSSGPAIDAWVNPSNPGPDADTRRVDSGQGELTVAVRATDVGGGRWRYEYAVMNHDFDAMVGSFAVPLPAGTTVTNATFHDVDRNPATDWVAKIAPGDNITWHAPASVLTPLAYGQDWGLLYNFGFEVDAAPSGPQARTVTVGGVDGRPRPVLQVGILGPQ